MIGFIQAGVNVYIHTRHRNGLEILWSLRRFTSIIHQLGVSLINWAIVYTDGSHVIVGQHRDDQRLLGLLILRIINNSISVSASCIQGCNRSTLTQSVRCVSAIN